MVGDIRIDIADPGTVKSLFDDFYVPLCLFAEHYVEDPQVAEDIVQECFIRLWQQKRVFENRYRLRAFLYTSVRNSALNEIERQKVVFAFKGKESGKAEKSFFRDHLIEAETYRILMSAIDNLPAQTRKVMLLALEGNDNKEIADQLDIAVGTVHSLKKIAYKRLREELREYFYLILLFL